MLSNVRNLFEKLTEPESDNDLEEVNKKVLEKHEEIDKKEEVILDDVNGWQLVNIKGVKKEKNSPKNDSTSMNIDVELLSGNCTDNHYHSASNGTRKDEDKREGTFLLSKLIEDYVCIHCMQGKCREGSKNHSNVYYPDGYTSYIKNPLLIQDLNDIIKKNPIMDERFKGYSIQYSICMRNHCARRCKLNHSYLVFKDDNGDEGKIHFCYPDLHILHRKKIVLGLHIDIKYVETNGKQPDILWMPLHNEEEAFIEEIKKEPLEIKAEESTVKKTLSTWAKLVATKTVEENDDHLPSTGKTELKIDTTSPHLTKKQQVESTETNSILSFSTRRPNSTPFRGNPVINELFEIVKKQEERLKEESKKIDLLVEMNQKLIRMTESYQDQFSILRSDMKIMKDTQGKMNDIHKMVSKSIDSREKYRLFSEFLKDSNNSITEQIVMTNHDRYIVFN
jgi:hypothetical protein